MSIAFADRIASELKLPAAHVRAAIELFLEGATVPFVARYRKERTGGLDEVQLRAIEVAHEYAVELDARRRVVLAEIESQGKLGPELRRRLEATWSKSELEDLYLPFKPKRRTRAKIARDKGLEPLALRILAQPQSGNVQSEAAAFVRDAGATDVADALAGARDIVAEIVADRADVRAAIRTLFRKDAVIVAARARGAKVSGPTKFDDYVGFRERLAQVPSHRFLALQRGEAEGVLRVDVEVDEARASREARSRVGIARSPFAAELEAAVDDAVTRLVCPSLANETSGEQKLAADHEAIEVFAANMRKLLLSAPLGRQVVLGIDPGQRTGCKCVVVDDTGKLQTHTVINLVQGDAALTQAKTTLVALLRKYAPRAVAVGNGTHGRETESFVRGVLKELGQTDVAVVSVSESGASVYSASDVAREEFPDLDLTVRGAVSIARRLQDPLSELVKVDPKTVGVGQYQHDVSQPLLKRKLSDVVESCVNAVGVELNTASAQLLEHVAGVGAALARKIVQYREKNGAFRGRKDLLKVPGLGPKAYEQCAGFVRVRDGAHALDASAVHPERYALVERIAKEHGVALKDLIGSAERVATIPWSSYVSGDVGLPTLQDIQAELVKPGRDPRSAFDPPKFRDDVRTLDDLHEGMQLEGVVTNVTAFGAFVDLGVHQDGLVHVSELADRFVKNPHEVVQVGTRLQVRVLGVDKGRKRISLSARTRPAD